MLNNPKCTSSLVFFSIVQLTIQHKIVRSTDPNSLCTCLSTVKHMTRVPQHSCQAFLLINKLGPRWQLATRLKVSNNIMKHPLSQLNTKDNLFQVVASEYQKMTSGGLLSQLLQYSQRKDNNPNRQKIQLYLIIVQTKVPILTTMAIEITMKK